VYLAAIGMPGESYHRQLTSLLLYLRYVFQALINSLCVDTEKNLFKKEKNFCRKFLQPHSAYLSVSLSST